MNNDLDNKIEETNSFADVVYKATWMPAPFCPTSNITQVSAFCINQRNEYLLVSTDGINWHIPGGHPEPNETSLQALTREIEEETCSDLIKATYLGARKVVNTTNKEIHYQMRFYCTVRTNAFDPSHEIREMKSIQPSMFLSELSYGNTAMAQELFRLAEKLRCA